MPNAISNTSPMVYLYRINGLQWLPAIFDEIWLPGAVNLELQVGLSNGYHVPNPADYSWLTIVDPISIPSEWLVSDLGAGEIAAIALTLENPDRIVLLDDALARRTAQAAELHVWGTLKVLLEAKSHRLISKVEPYITQLSDAGMWIADSIKQRILKLANEN